MTNTTIHISDVVFSTNIVIAVLLIAFLASFRKTQHTDLFPIPVTQELKGLGMFTIVFAHISYMLVDDYKFLYPLSIASGVGVDLFLFMSGYGLTVGMLKKPLAAVEFYKRRLIKVFIPFWLALTLLFAADAGLLNIHYEISYMVQSFFGWFPRASAYEDVNSPFWYITWLLMFYALFPLLFSAKRPWLTAIILAVLANLFATIDPLNLQVNWLHRLHTCAFSFGIVFAWIMQESKDAKNSFVENMKWFRNKSKGIGRYLIIAVMTLFALYMSSHTEPSDWQALADFLKQMSINENKFIGQAVSLLTMFALIIVFALKKLDNKLFYIFGVYSYETYLLHWPLMYRYDIYFNLMPAWAAVLMWLITFVIVGWILQKITTPLGAWLDSKW